MAEELFRHLLKGKQFENVEEVHFEELLPEDKKQLTQNLQMDIDFFLLAGTCKALFSEPFTNRILSNISGTYVNSPYVMRLQGCVYSSCLIIADAKP